MSSDLQAGTLIQGSGTNSATATLTVPAARRGYILAASVEIVAGTATLCNLALKNGGSTVFAQDFPVQGAATAAGGSFIFPFFVCMTTVNSDLTVVATTTGATSTNVYAVVQLGP